MTRLDWRESKDMNRQQRRALDAENRRHPEALAEIPPHRWPADVSRSIEKVWRSREFLVQLYNSRGHLRLSVNRTRLLGNGRWDDGISWDELQRLKAEAGFGERWAVEVYPADDDVVNVANMRHLWLLAERPAFAWHEGMDAG